MEDPSRSNMANLLTTSDCLLTIPLKTGMLFSTSEVLQLKVMARNSTRRTGRAFYQTWQHVLTNSCLLTYTPSVTGVLLSRPEVIDLAVMTSSWLDDTLPAIVGCDSAGLPLCSSTNAALVKQVNSLSHWCAATVYLIASAREVWRLLLAIVCNSGQWV